MTKILIDTRLHSHPDVIRHPRGRHRLEAVGTWVLALSESVSEGRPDDAPETFPGVAWKLEHPSSEWAIDPVDRAFIYTRDRHQCLACGSAADLSIDHVVPKSFGGAHARENFQTLCRPCNSSKGVQTIDYRAHS